MRKFSFIFLILTIFFALVSCAKEENYVSCENEEPRSSISSFTFDVDYTKSFSYNSIEKSGYISYMGEETGESMFRFTEIKIQFDADTKVFAFYKKDKQLSSNLNIEILGYVQYDEKTGYFVQTNSYTKTYRILDFKNIEEVFDYLFNKKAGYFFFETIYSSLDNLKNSTVLKSNINKHYKIFNELENENYLYELHIESYYMTLKGEIKTNYSDGDHLKTYDYLLVIDENDLQPLDLKEYTLYPVE